LLLHGVTGVEDDLLARDVSIRQAVLVRDGGLAFAPTCGRAASVLDQFGGAAAPIGAPAGALVSPAAAVTELQR
jgi:hypothetical protein